MISGCEVKASAEVAFATRFNNSIGKLLICDFCDEAVAT
jgi:hypothetical protein